MNVPGRSGGKSAVAALVVAIVLATAPAVASPPRWIEETLSGDLGPLASDPVRERVYLSDWERRELVVLDTESEAVITRIPTTGRVFDFAFSVDGGTLAVAAEAAVGLLDAEQLAYREIALPPEAGFGATSLAFHSSGLLLVAINLNPQGWSSSSRVYVMTQDGAVLGSFGSLVSPHNFRSPLLRRDATGNRLYVDDGSPLHILDVENPTSPRLIAHRFLACDNLQDMALSPRLPELYLACGSPYGLQVVGTEPLTQLELLPTGPYAVATAVGPLGNSVFLLTGNVYNDYLFQFDAASRSLLVRSPLATLRAGVGSGDRRGLALDRRGAKAFVVHGSSHPVTRNERVQVLDVARELPARFLPSASPQLVRVAILTMSTTQGDPIDHSADEIDGMWLLLGPARALPMHRPQERDVDGDGDRDLLLTYRARDLAVDCSQGGMPLEVRDGDFQLRGYALLTYTGEACAGRGAR